MTVRALHIHIDVPLLRTQRDALVEFNREDGEAPSVEIIDGLINLCDYLLDVAEGFDLRGP